MADSILYYGGVEGGATTSKFILIDSNGKILSDSVGGGTNQYLIGIDECLRIIDTMVKDSLEKAHLRKDTVLEGIGMSLSGGDEKSSQEAIIKATKDEHPGMARHIFVGSDTQSALASALPNGGVVFIAGTGSNCQLINPDGSMRRCGGWGHMIGDESSAAWISLRAIKIYLDHEDNFVRSEHPVSVLKECLFKCYKLENDSGLLDLLYSNFVKANIASLCKVLAEAAQATKDPVCCGIFEEAGKLMARHIFGISEFVAKELKTRAGGLPIVCVGSVFKSWDLLQQGFVKEMKERKKETGIDAVTLLSLNVNASIGAAFLGAHAAGKTLPMDYSNTASVFFQQKF